MKRLVHRSIRAALACDGFMAAAAILQGRVHYPIPYPPLRMAGWILGAILLFSRMHFFLAIAGEPGSWVMRNNSGLLALYAWAILKLERPLLRQLLRHSVTE